MSTDNTQELLQAGIRAARQGNQSAARRLLREVVAQDANNEIAWIWLASVAETANQRREFLEHVLKINPNNERAQQALQRMDRRPSLARPPRPTSASGPTRSTGASSPARDSANHPPGRERRRRMSRQAIIIQAIVGFLLLGVGLVLAWSELNSDDSEPTSTPIGVAVVAEADTPTPTRTPRNVTPRPTRPPLTPPPTWTPTATWTPTTTAPATATLPPLDIYDLLASEQRNGSWTLSTIPATGFTSDALTVTLSETELSAGWELTDVLDAIYSPDGSQIAFTGRIRTDPEARPVSELFVAPSEGGTAQRLTELEADALESASWSSDGQRIAFASDADGDFDIYIVTLDGGNAVPITRNAGEDRYPAWSPQNNIIAFATDLAGPGELEIYSMNPQGDNLRRLTNNANDSYAPAWSPDGTRIVFVSDRRGNNDLYTMTADGRDERAILPRDVAAEEYDPAWSPDGQWIAFSSNREGMTLDLYLIRPDGSTIQRLTAGDDSVTTRYPDWLPL